MLELEGRYLPDEATRTQEAALVAQLRAGEESAFVALIEMYNSALMRLARQYVDTAALADEVVQDTWIALLDSLPRFEGRSSLKTWIFRILVNVARSRRRKEARSIPFSSAFPAEDDQRGPEPAFFPSWVPKLGGHWFSAPERWEEQPDQVALSSETRALLDGAIDGLPAGQREVITLRDIEGYGPDEVCNILGISDTNQRVLLHRARTKVRKALAPHLGVKA
jgi:RNA polymerase sigma-70 factor (ECF subfamily)